jgi:hypothetical protein
MPNVELVGVLLNKSDEFKLEHTNTIKTMTDEELEGAIAFLHEMMAAQAVESAHLVEMKAEPAALPAPGGQSPEKLSSKRKPNRLMIEVDTAIGPQERTPRSRFSASGSSWESLARGGVPMDNSRRWQRAALEECTATGRVISTIWRVVFFDGRIFSAARWILLAIVSSFKNPEPVRRHVGVPDRVLDVLVPEVVLQGPRVVAIVGELEPTGVAMQQRCTQKLCRRAV